MSALTRSDLMAAACAAVPDYERLTRLAAQLKERTLSTAAAVRDAVAAVEVAQATLMEQIVETGDVVDEPEVYLREARDAEAAIKERFTLFERAAVVVDGQLDEAVRRHHEAAFAVLDTELDSVMATIRGLGPIPLTADDAIKSGRVDAFSGADECVVRYNVVRATWADLWKKVGGPAPHTTPCQWVKPEVILEWHPPTLRRCDPDGPRDADGLVVVPRAWPGWRDDEPLPTGPWPIAHDDRLPWLIWASVLEALWAPSPARLDSASDQVAVAVSAAIADSNRGRVRSSVEREPTRRELAHVAAMAADEREVAARRTGLDDY